MNTNHQKYIGTILWFGTADGAKYGFIQYENELNKDSSIFFHKNKIAKSNLSELEKFDEGQIVTFFIKQSDKKSHKTEAYEVLLIENEADKEFLLSSYFLLTETENKIYKKLNNIISNQFDDYLKFTPIIDKEILRIIDNNYNLEKISIFNQYIENNTNLHKIITNKYTILLSQQSDFIIDKIENIEKVFSKNSVLYKNFITIVLDNLKTNRIKPFEKISSLNYIINKDDFNIINIFDILKNQKLIYIKEILFSSELELDNYEKLYFLNKFKNFEFFIENFKNTQELKKLFIFIQSNNIDSIYYNIFLNLFKKSLKNNIKINTYDFISLAILLNNHNLTPEIYSIVDIIEITSLEEIFYNTYFSNIEISIKKIIIKKLINQKYISALTDYDKIYYFINTLNQYQLHEEKQNFIEFLSVNTKIILWLDDKISYFNYDLYKDNIINLESHHQQLFIKKIFYMIQNGSILKQLNDILDIRIDDYSTKVIFSLLEKISHQQKLNKNFLKYDLLSSFSSSNLEENIYEILQIQGYFDLCHGRTCEHYIEIDSSFSLSSLGSKYLRDGNRIGDKQYYYTRESVEYMTQNKQKPIICDGRWSGNSNGQYRFMWCRNKQCFETARVPKNIENWQNYSLIDFLNILKIPYNSEQIEILYATINHINKFLSHMNCKSCGKLLKPQGNTNYTFYRVSTFYCDNKFCHNPDTNVYISHCSNGSCNGTIDSRNSRYCNNGWVICNDCFACCDKERLDKRNHNRLINGMSKVVWSTPNGHRGYDILCPKCANPMKFKDIQQKQQGYNNVIQDFERLANLDIPNNQKLVGKYGVNSSNKKWFVVYQRHLDREDFLNYLYYWQSLGFNIVDFEDKTKSNYLITEPTNEKALAKTTYFYCQTCNHSYDYIQKYDKYRAVKYWHHLN